MPGMNGVQFLKAFRMIQPNAARLILLAMLIQRPDRRDQ